MKISKKQKTYQQIEAHGNNLIHLFNLPEDTDPVKLCKRIHNIEAKANRATTNLCNTNTLTLSELNRYTGYDVKQATEEEVDAFFDKIRNSLDKILNFKKQGIPVFINHDPRGYALKIRSEWVAGYQSKGGRIYSDLGGYGILAPEFDGN